MNMTLKETITALTLNAAAAVDKTETLGMIEPGKQADMIVLDAPSYDHLTYHIGVNSVWKTIKYGEVVWEKGKPDL